MISWKLYWTVGGFTLTAGGTALMSLAGVPLVAAIVVLLAAAVLFRIAAGRIVRASPVFKQVSIESTQQIVHCMTAAAVAYVAWGAAFLVTLGVLAVVFAAWLGVGLVGSLVGGGPWH